MERKNGNDNRLGTAIGISRAAIQHDLRNKFKSNPKSLTSKEADKIIFYTDLTEKLVGDNYELSDDKTNLIRYDDRGNSIHEIPIEKWEVYRKESKRIRSFYKTHNQQPPEPERDYDQTTTSLTTTLQYA